MSGYEHAHDYAVDAAGNRIALTATSTRDDALDRAAYALFRAAGRPDTLWNTLTEHEKTGWRHCVTVTMNAYRSDPKED